VSSFHERFFRKDRLGQFYPRGPKARRSAYIGLAVLIGLGGIGIALLLSGQRMAGQVVLGGLLFVLVVYNGFMSTRSDL
jgi:hypothetical protein